MSSTAESYFTALIALSGNPALTEARKALLGSIQDADLERLVKHGIAREFNRKDSEAIALTILDVVATSAKTNEANTVEAETAREVIKIEDDDEEDIVHETPRSEFVVVTKWDKALT